MVRGSRTSRSGANVDLNPWFRRASFQKKHFNHLTGSRAPASADAPFIQRSLACALGLTQET
jgi:hypothetical protein